MWLEERLRVWSWESERLELRGKVSFSASVSSSAGGDCESRPSLLAGSAPWFP